MDRLLTGALAFAAGAYACHYAKEHDMMLIDKRDMKKMKKRIAKMMW